MTTSMMNNAVGPQVRRRKSRRGKLVPAMGTASLAAGLCAATQHFAQTLDYHASLGMHVGHAYLPWQVLGWAAKWYDACPSLGHSLLNARSPSCALSHARAALAFVAMPL